MKQSTAMSRIEFTIQVITMSNCAVVRMCSYPYYFQADMCHRDVFADGLKNINQIESIIMSCGVAERVVSRYIMKCHSRYRNDSCNAKFATFITGSLPGV